jgi:uroporphyrinogen-III synthase
MTPEKRKTFLAIRPTDRWESTRAAFAALPVDLVLADVLIYTPTGTSLPDLSDITAVIITSLRAIQSIPVLPSRLHKLPFYVVGVETARALRVMGLSGPQTVASTAQALLDIIKADDQSRTFLYICGDETAVDFRKELAPDHTVRDHLAYTSRPKEQLDADTITRIKTGRVDSVLFFSKSSAKAFMELAKEADIQSYLSSLSALCLSSSVLRSVHSNSWAQTGVAESPDLSGMVALVRTFEYEQIKEGMVMAKQANGAGEAPGRDQGLNADAIIERFGGIRPMATKMGVPVTTVQGWKKRGVIPGNRAHLIEQAASAHGVELSGLVSIVSGDAVTHISLPRKPDGPKPEESTKSQTDDLPDISAVLSDIAKMVRDIPEGDVDDVAASASIDSAPRNDVGQRPQKSEHTVPPVMNRRRSDTIARATWLSVILLAFAVIVGLVTLAPGALQMKAQDERLAALQSDLATLVVEIQSLRRDNAVLETLVPDDLKDQMKTLSGRAADMEQTVTTLATQSKALTAGVMGPGKGSMEQRLSDVEGRMKTLATQTGSVPLAAFLNKVQLAQTNESGRAALKDAAAQLFPLVISEDVKTAKGDDVTVVYDKIDPGTPLGQMLVDVTGRDRVAAIKILALVSFGQALQTNKTALVDVLPMVSAVLGAGYPSVTEALAALDETVKDGVMTVDALRAEFETLAPKLVAAVVDAPGTSWSDRLWAKLHKTMRVDYAGKSVTGLPVQRRVDQIRAALAKGDLEAARDAAVGLDSRAASLMGDWMKQAKYTMAATGALNVAATVVAVDISLHPTLQSLSAFPQAKLDPDAIARGIVHGLLAQ